MRSSSTTLTPFSTHVDLSLTHAALRSAQVLLQIFACVNFLSLLGATFLFRSGLFGILYKQFRPTLLSLPAYIALTTILAGIRLVRHQESIGWHRMPRVSPDTGCLLCCGSIILALGCRSMAYGTSTGIARSRAPTSCVRSLLECA